MLNLQLQGLGVVITDMYAAVRTFITKLCLWETQMVQGSLGHFPCCQTLKSKSQPTCFQVHSLLKNSAHSAHSAHSAPSLPGNLPTLKPRNVGLNCSVIHLQLTWKAHQPTSKWSWLKSCVVIRSSQSMTLWAQHSFHVSSPTQWPNSVHKLLKCSLCSAAHIYVNSYSLWWRWTKHHTGVVSLMKTFTQSWRFLQLGAWPSHWWTSIKEKMPGIWLGPVCIRVNQSVANWAWILIWVYFIHFFLATARHGLLIVELLDFHWRKLFVSLVVCLWKRLYTENKLERLQIERGIRIILFYFIYLTNSKKQMSLMCFLFEIWFLMCL